MMSRRTRLTTRYAAKLLLLVLALWLTWKLLDGVTGRDLEEILTRARPEWIAVAVALLAVRLGLWSWRWHLAVRRAGYVAHPLLLLGAISGAAAVNQITPAARVLGGLFRARWLHRFGSPSMGDALGGVLFDQVSNQVMMTITFLAALVAGVLLLGQPELAVAVAVLLLVAGTVVVVMVRRRGTRPLAALVGHLAARAARSDGRAQRLFQHGHRAVEVVSDLGSDRVLWRRSLALGWVFFLVQAAAQVAAFKAVGVSAGLGTVLVVVALGGSIGTMLGTPGGLGTTEAAMIAGYMALGLGHLEATAGTLLFRALHYGLLLLPGIPAFALLEIKSGDVALAATEATTPD